jgi:hypothetical protein
MNEAAMLRTASTETKMGRLLDIMVIDALVQNCRERWK